MDKYAMFRKLMGLISDYFDVTYAFMDTSSPLGIVVEGERNGLRIKISANLEEVKQDA